MGECRVCRAAPTETLLKLGKQPVSSHFTQVARASVVEHDLTLTACPACSAVQLAEPFPFRDLVPPFAWLTYREPEAHLDAVVDKICTLPDVGRRANVLGISYKDLTTIERFRSRGFGSLRIIDPCQDLEAPYPNANIETVHGLLSLDTAGKLVQRHGPADVLVVRHILEHSECSWRFMEALGALLAPGGYVVIEVPDCAANLVRQDITMIWEEHCHYFTREVLPQVLASAGCSFVGMDVHPYPFEDVLLLYGRKVRTTSISRMVEPAAIQQNLALARSYANSHNDWTRQYQRLFDSLTSDGRKLAAYGAGHLTCAFLNFHDVAGYFAFVVDDTALKQGLYLPKVGLPIVPRTELKADTISACLFGFGPETEDKVIANNRSYAEAGGQFYSMLADSPRSIRSLLTN